MNNRYKITEALGEDVLGTVHLAEDTMLQRRVMVRVIEHGESDKAKKRDDKWRKKFAKYTGKMSTMQHPNLLTIYDVSLDDKGATLVNQYIEGESLSDRLERGAVSQIGVYRMASDMLEALHAAHDSEIYHGALHIGSIRRVHRASGGHRCLLIDLGLNQLVSMIKGDQVHMADPVLMAPELHDEDRKSDAKADLFMLGQLCYTALVGGHPYSDKSEEECKELYALEGMPHINSYLDDINPEFAQWIMQMVECDPEKRPENTSHAMAVLAAIQLNEPEPNVPGETHAVEQAGGDDNLSQVGTSAHPVTTGAEVVSGQTTVANSGASGGNEVTKAQIINIASREKVLDREAKEKKIMTLVIGVLSLALVIGGIVLISKVVGGRSSDDLVKDDVQSSEAEPYSLEIGEGELVHTVLLQDNPVKIKLDNENTLDWIIGAAIPISSEYTTKGEGYFQAVRPLGVDSERVMVSNPIRFVNGNRVTLPKATIRTGSGAKVGSGYELKLKIPEGASESLSLDLYLVQKKCDLRVEIDDLDNRVSKFVDVIESDEGVFKVPVKITNPKGGELYTIKVLVTKVGSGGKMQLSFSGASVNLDS